MANNAVKADSQYAISSGGKSAKVNVKIIPSNFLATKDVASYVKKGQPFKPCKKMFTGKPLGITVHNTPDINSLLSGISSAAEQYILATYNGNMGGAIVQYYVSPGVIWQLLADDEQGWHSGTGSARVKGKRGALIGGNTDTISIECVGNPKEAEDTTALLVAYLCDKYGFDVNLDVYTHKEWSGKHCPAYILPHWNSFISTVKNYLADMKTVAPIPDTLYRVQVGAFSVKANADKCLNELKSKGFSAIVTSSVVGGKQIYRVQVGAFSIKANADACLKQLVGLGYSAVVLG
jgi:N-acetylmuramoyl-L-alanine amidase